MGQSSFCPNPTLVRLINVCIFALFLNRGSPGIIKYIFLYILLYYEVNTRVSMELSSVIFFHVCLASIHSLCILREDLLPTLFLCPLVVDAICNPRVHMLEAWSSLCSVTRWWDFSVVESNKVIGPLPSKGVNTVLWDTGLILESVIWFLVLPCLSSLFPP